MRPTQTGGYKKISINRNILECKVVNALDLLITGIVLIETYWNVKQGIKNVSSCLHVY